MQFEGRQSGGRERTAGHPGHPELDVNMVVGKVHQVLRHEFRRELFFQEFRVPRAHSENDHGAHVAEDRIPDLGGLVVYQLPDILVSNDEIQPILARFGENTREGVCGEILELVHIQIEIHPLFLRNAHPLHGGQLYLGDDHRAQKRGIVLADAAFGYVDQEDLAAVHELEDVDGALGLTHDVPDKRGGQELADLVLNGRDGLVPELVLPLFVLVHPERLDHRVGHVSDYLLPVFFVDQKPRHAQKGRTGIVQKREYRVVQNVFHPGGPDSRPDLGENAHQTRSHQMLVLGVGQFQDIEADMIVGVGGVEINHVVHPLFGDHLQDPLHQLAVRVHHADALAVRDILDDHVVLQGAFAGTRLSDDIKMLAPVLALYPIQPVRVPIVRAGEIYDVFVGVDSHGFKYARLPLGAGGALRHIIRNSETFGSPRSRPVGGSTPDHPLPTSDAYPLPSASPEEVSSSRTSSPVRRYRVLFNFLMRE